MLWETSLLDAAEGIRFRGYTIPECQELLPTFKGPAGDGEPTPEAILWLLLTGEIPTKEQCDGLTAELFERSALPAHATQLLDSLPKTMHPMTQFSLGLQAYRCGVLYVLDPSCLRALSRRRRRARHRCDSCRMRAVSIPRWRVDGLEDTAKHNTTPYHAGARPSRTSPRPTATASTRASTGSRRTRTCWMSLPNWRRSRRASTATPILMENSSRETRRSITRRIFAGCWGWTRRDLMN